MVGCDSVVGWWNRRLLWKVKDFVSKMKNAMRKENTCGLSDVDISWAFLSDIIAIVLVRWS